MVFLFASYPYFCLIVFSCFDGDNLSVRFANFCKSLRFSCFEKFFYSRKTLRDIAAGYTARMEGSHCKLSTRFTDGLCGCDSDSLTNINFFTCCQVSAVALRTHACSCMACHYGTNCDAFDSARFDFLCCVFHDFIVLFNDNLSRLWVYDIDKRCSSDDSLLQRFDYFLAVSERSYFHTFVSSAVVFSYDYVMGYVYKSSCEVSGVGRTKSCVGKTFTSTV